MSRAIPLAHSALSALLMTAALAACTTEAATPAARSTVEAPAEPSAEPAVGSTPPLKSGVDPEIVAALRTAGFTLETLPADLQELHEPGHERMRAVMKTFTIALGTTCDGCHVAGATTDEELRVDTPRKRVARKMWTEFVTALRRKDGAPIYCDTCHQGKIRFLDRDDRDALREWMQANFVDGLARNDGADHTCATCHGAGEPGRFLDAWRKL